jgi:hypothetical protein
MSRHWVCEAYHPQDEPKPEVPSATCRYCGGSREDFDFPGSFHIVCPGCGANNFADADEPIVCDGCGENTWEWFLLARVVLLRHKMAQAIENSCIFLKWK